MSARKLSLIIIIAYLFFGVALMVNPGWQEYKTDEFSVKYPKTWYLAANRTKDGEVYSIVISDTPEKTSPQQAKPLTGSLELTIGKVPKEAVNGGPDWVPGKMVSGKSNLNFKFFKKMRVNSTDVFIANVNDQSEDGYFSKEVLAYFDSGKNYVYRLDGGLWNKRADLIGPYKYELINKVVESFTVINSSKQKAP